MMNRNVEEIIVRHIKELSEEKGRLLPEVTKDQSIMEDLNLTSMQISTLVSCLETDFGVDPFATGEIGLMDVSTVGELCEIYEDALRKKN